jgi:malate synthase
VGTALQDVEVRGRAEGRASEVLTPEGLLFVAELQRRFGSAREALLSARRARQAAFDRGERPGFLPATRAVREGSWRVAPPPDDLRDRRVEITGPVDRRMMVHALNSRARVFMADFEDALSPTWDNVLQGQANLHDAVRRALRVAGADGRVLELGPAPAVLVVRPRGWHLPEKHVRVDGQAVSASLFDAGLYAFHNARELARRGSGCYLYLPKLESHLEAQLWDEVFDHVEGQLALPRGSVRATVLLETVTAAFEMDEILHALRAHAGGLNAGRWDYIFSCIKKFRAHGWAVLPDRRQVTMTVPFLRAYTDLLVRTCHARGAHAIGGMAAFVPDRRDPRATEAALAGVREDKEREARQGFDGTWVAHPDLVPVATEVFDGALGARPNQLDVLRADARVAPDELLDLRVPGGRVTEEGVRNNVEVALRYTESWLRGQGAVALHHLMEDAATAEIARSQLWQWVRHGTALPGGARVTRGLVGRVMGEELARVEAELGPAFALGRFKEARALLDEAALGEGFPEFLTIPAYEHLG